MHSRLALVAAFAALAGTACEDLGEPHPVMGNYAVSYENNLRVYIGDTLVAEVAEGEDATVTLDGSTFQVSQLCGAEGTECPGDTFWREVAVDQPWGEQNALLNFVNLDPDRGVAGQRMGGLLETDESFAMLAGLGIAANEACVVIGVGAVTGRFSADHATIDEGVIAYEWSGGCVIGDVALGSSLRLETDYVATRTGDYDVSSVTPAPPIDEEGEEIDPEEPADTAVE